MAWLSILCAAGAARAQVATGTISGYVFDPSGRPIAGATVSVTDSPRAFVRTVTTDDKGLFSLTDVPPSTYDVTASLDRFEPSRRIDVTLPVDGHLRIDFHLRVAGVSETVEVTATVEPVQTQSVELGAVIDQRRIESLPLNRRDFLQLAMLTPGVNPPAQGSELSSRGAFAMAAGGGREEFNNYLLDGVDNNDPYVNRYVVEPSVDAIQEFKIATNSYSAEYGRSAAGQVNVVTRSGSNRLQLTGYEYFRNAALNARNAFDTAPEEPPFNRNQLGFSVGGPIVRNRTFGFANVDYLRERRSVTTISTVPTDAERQGNLSDLGVTIRDPFTGQPFQDGTIPPDRIDPVAQQILKMFPPSNRPGTVANYLHNAPFSEDQVQATFRVDQKLSDSAMLTARYSYGRVKAVDPYGEDPTTAPGFGQTYTDPAHNGMLRYQRVFGRAVSSTLFGFNRYSRDILPANSGTNVGDLWGVTWLDVPERDYGYPAIAVAGLSRVGDSTNLPIQRTTTTYQASQTFAIERGRHLWKFGGEARHAALEGNLDLFTRGSLSFSGFISGAGLSDLLLGLPSFSMQAQSNNPLNLRTTTVAGFVQDEWRARPDLTVSLGLRYEYNTPASDPTNGMSIFDLATGTVVPVGTQGIPASGVRPDRDNFAPRVGLAWSPRRGFVVRGGYGVYYDSGMFETASAMYFNPPQFTLRVFFPTEESLLTLADPFPTGGGYVPPPSLSTLSPDLVTSLMQQWNVTVQRQLGSLGTLSVGYAGSRGSDLIRPRDLNQPRPAPGDPQENRPYPEFGSIFYIESAGRSTYHSMQLVFDRPLSGGWALSAAYTLSKSMDDGSSFLGTTGDANFPQDSQNMAAQWGPSNFDVRHRFTASFIYQLPGTNAVTRNTEVRGIVTLQSGQPFTPVLQFDNSNTGNTGQQSGYDHPNLVGNPDLADPTASGWFNTAAFAIPERYTFGNSGRNILRGPGYASVDLSLARRFRFGGGRSLALEAQAFNLLNRVNYDLPHLYVDDPATFGKIYSAKAPRQVQLVVRVAF
jgi:hypothetical protein